MAKDLQPDILPEHPPVVPIPQDPFIPTGRLRRIVARFSGGQFLRYLMVGVFNTIFGYLSFVIILTLLNHAVPQRFLYLTVIAASIISSPINITVAYFGYKFFVFRTSGNYLREWLKCFAVYGTGQIPGLLALSGLTKLLQTTFHTHADTLRPWLATLESHLGGGLRHAVEVNATGKNMAGYIAGAIVIGVSTVYSFIGHKKVTFKQREQAQA